MENFQKVGYIISVLGVATILIWIGIFKFTPTEAKEIKPMIANSPLMSWLYLICSDNATSRLIGIIEILTGILLIISLIVPKVGLVSGTMSLLTFILTLSFLFSTPGAFQKIDGIWLPDAFILKDLMALGISLMVLGKSQ